MIKKFIISLCICGVFWAITRQQNDIPARLKLENNPVKLTAASEKKFISIENQQPKQAVINSGTIQANTDIPDTSNINFTMKENKFVLSTTKENYSNNTQTKKLYSSDAVWNARKFIITATAKNHSSVNDLQVNTNELKQQSQAESENNASIQPDKVHCPSVEKIQQTAQKINKAFYAHDIYEAMSYDPAFQDSNVAWLVAVIGVAAVSSDEAIYLAGIAASKTNLRKNEYAEKADKSFTNSELFDIFVCRYGSDNIMAVGIWDKMLIDQ